MSGGAALEVSHTANRELSISDIVDGIVFRVGATLAYYTALSESALDSAAAEAIKRLIGM